MPSRHWESLHAVATTRELGEEKTHEESGWGASGGRKTERTRVWRTRARGRKRDGGGLWERNNTGAPVRTNDTAGGRRSLNYSITSQSCAALLLV